MYDFLHGSGLQSRVPISCCLCRIELFCRYQNRSYLHLTFLCLVSREPIKNLSCFRNLRQFVLKLEFSLQLQMMQS